jgi:polyferredoxin
MPVFMGDFRHFGLDTTNEITMVMTTLSLTLTAAFLAGMFFKDRFFCIFCPLLALISLYDRIGLVRLRKRVDSCKGCGNCERICPANIRKVHTEMEKEDVLTQDCLECFRCAESCPGDGTLFISVLGRRLFSSSSSYLGDSFRRAK